MVHSIVEQKNRPECKIAMNVLITGRNIDGRTSHILRRWRLFDNDLTDALSEAKVGALPSYVPPFVNPQLNCFACA